MEALQVTPDASNLLIHFHVNVLCTSGFDSKLLLQNVRSKLPYLIDTAVVGISKAYDKGGGILGSVLYVNIMFVLEEVLNCWIRVEISKVDRIT